MSVEAELLEASARRPLVFEAAWDPNLATFHELWQAYQSNQPESPYVLTHPHLVRGLHDLYLTAGCDILQTHSWFDLGNDPADENPNLDTLARNAYQAAQIASAAARDAQSATRLRRWVAGVVPAQTVLRLGIGDADRARRKSRAVASALIEGAVDILVVALPSGIPDIEAHLTGTVEAASESHTQIPIFVSIELEPVGFASGDDVGTALALAERHERVFSAGAYLTTHLEQLPERHFTPAARHKPTHVFADAGYTSFDENGGGSRGSLSPIEYGRAVAAQARRLGLRFVGGGWALTPSHICELRRAVDPNFV